MTRKLIYAMAGLLALNATAFAADMPLKARPAPLPLFYGGAGSYCGVEAGATQTKLGTVTPVVGSGGANIYSAGGTMSLTCGYTFAVGVDRWAAFEVSGNGSNADATTVDGNGVLVNSKRRYSFDITAMYGAPASVLSGLFTNSAIAFGALPPSPCVNGGLACIASNVHPFLLVGARYGNTTTEIADIGLGIFEESHNKLRFKAGVGAIAQVTNSTVWRTTFDWTFGSQNKGAGFLFVPGAPISEGGTLTIKTGLFYAMSGGGI